MIDMHYTSPELALAMVNMLPMDFAPKVVADFSAGEGSLLLAAQEKWPNAEIVANDINTIGAQRLRRKYPRWRVSGVDFMAKESRVRAQFSSRIGSVDLILLNPPFSERGRVPTQWDGTAVTSGLALGFIWAALPFLSQSGCLLAILPSGCMTSNRDAKGWEKIKLSCSVKIVGKNLRSAFKGVAACTTIVMIRRRVSNRISNKKSSDIVNNRIAIIRGVTQMHSAVVSDVGYPLVHSSHLKNSKVAWSRSNLVKQGRNVKGPAVVFPRVGRITEEKICVLECGVEIILSDCVLAIPVDSLSRAEKLRQDIVNEWLIFSREFGGTGAPYITVSRAVNVIESIWKDPFCVKSD